jgi:hypothetical protein
MPCEPTQGTHHLSIGWLIGHLDHSCIPIFDCSLAYPTHSPFQYSLSDRLLRLFQDLNIGCHSPFQYSLNAWLLRWFHDSNIGCHASRLESLTIWILFELSGIPTRPVFQYWITCWPTLRTHHFNIHWMVGYSDYSMIPILVVMLAGLRHSPFESLYSNIQSLVSLLGALTNSISLEWSVTLIMPWFHYWILCWPTKGCHHMNTGWIIGHSDRTCIQILDHLLAHWAHSPFQYSLNGRLLRLFFDLNIGCHVSRLQALIIWVLVLYSNIQLLVCSLDALTISTSLEWSVTPITPWF